MKQISSMNKGVKHILAIVLVAVLIASASAYAVLAAKSNTTIAANDTTDTEKLTQTAEKATGSTTIPSADGQISKEETVYVKTDASGKVTSTTVSDWLKNAGTQTQIADTSTLADIKNVKGGETFTQNADGSLLWNTAGADIYYQGTTTQALPVSISTVYKLNGQSMNPQDMVGKSGQVEITMHFTNTATVNGTTVPFTVASAMMLPDDTFTNVAVDKGAVLSDGNNAIVVGLAFPGLNDSLGLSGNTLDLTIPDSITVTATAANFKLGPTITSMTSNVLEEAGLGQVNSFGDLDNSITKLTTATDQLVAGTLSAKDGANALATGAGSAVTGINTLADGLNTYTNGVATVAGGTTKLQNGLGTLSAGANSLNAGLTTAKAGSEQLVAGYKGSDTQNGAAQGAQELAAGASQVSQGVDTAAAGVDGMDTQINTSIDAIKAQMPQGVDSLEAAQSALSQLIAGRTQAIAVRDAATTVEEMAAYNQKIDVLSQQIATLSQGIGSWQVLETIRGQLETENADGQTMLDQLAALQAGASQVADGAADLNAGINGYDAADGHHAGLYEGTVALDAGLTDATQGSTALAQGANTATTSAAQLADGAATLASKNNELTGGMAQLQSGGAQLDAGANAIATGLSTLNSGMTEFKTTGIDKIANLYNNDLKGLKDRITKITDAGKAYNSFSGISNGMNGSVKFVVESGEIK
ncbi:putative membrane protein [Eubacterium aggregans]|uniref:Putative membrane protein n=1 Tax=Eubacterium aggregans TaxID=81409 RepID=A0A1H4BT96_9FIRM|nr:hypothetical protein [Eubacterium aggregans]SEA51406.1 putative membrane protein [Eubacterium aggregans]